MRTAALCTLILLNQIPLAFAQSDQTKYKAQTSTLQPVPSSTMSNKQGSSFCPQPAADFSQAIHQVRGPGEVIFAPIVVAGNTTADAGKVCPRDFLDMAGWLVLMVVKDKIISSHIEVSKKSFEQQLKQRVKTNPKKVLFLNLFTKDDKSSARVDMEIKKRMEGKPYVRIDGGSFSDTLEKLKALPQNASFDRIEIYGHGEPRGLFFGSDGVLASRIEKEFKTLDIATPGAELILKACETGREVKGVPTAETVLPRIASSLLKRGGTGFGTSKIVQSVPLPRALLNLSGLWLLVLPNLVRNNISEWNGLKQQKDIVSVRVAPAHDKAQCISHMLMQGQ
jgi:hypothetical protein